MKNKTAKGKKGRIIGDSEGFTELLTFHEPIRSTFYLRENVLTEFKDLLQFYKVKPKQIFEYLFLMLDDDDFYNEVNEIINEMINNKNIEQNRKKVRKTFVLSKGTNRRIKRISKEKGVSKSLVIESLIILTKRITEEKTRISREKYPKVLEKIYKFYKSAKEVQKFLNDHLPKDDPIIPRFDEITSIISYLVRALRSNIERKVPITEYIDQTGD